MTTHDAGNPDGAPLREHSFDGIQEFDNRLPTWWLWTFYLAIIFSAVYWVHFHLLKTGLSPEQEFALVRAEMEAREAARVVTPDELLALAADDNAVERGKATFLTHCLACHLADGRGLVGPNLTDDHWIYGPKIEDIHRTIQKGGLPDKGMIAWGPVLGSASVKDVTAYVWRALRHTNVQGGKAPEGQKEGG